MHNWKRWLPTCLIFSINNKLAASNVDFSENWQVKGLYEVQSAHFGASQSQVTLHTGVAYSAQKEPVAFCTLSDSPDHGPRAIWGHLVPVLEYFKDSYPHVKHLHFHTDGLVTQYRGRGNMHLLANIPFDFGFEDVYWNFSEAGHGKGPADDVGAAVKRLADNIVLAGTEVNNAGTLIEHLDGRTIFDVSSASAEAAQLPEVIPAVKGVMKVHQVYCNVRGTIHTRHVNCYCTSQFC